MYNVPDISDVKTTLAILECLGCKVIKDKKKVIIDSKNMNITTIPEELSAQIKRLGAGPVI